MIAEPAAKDTMDTWTISDLATGRSDLWLTDGIDYGINPGAVPELECAVKALIAVFHG